MYVAPEAVGRAVARNCCDDLLVACHDAGIREVIAVIADSADSADSADRASVELHRRFGFVDSAG